MRAHDIAFRNPYKIIFLSLCPVFFEVEVWRLGWWFLPLWIGAPAAVQRKGFCVLLSVWCVRWRESLFPGELRLRLVEARERRLQRLLVMVVGKAKRTVGACGRKSKRYLCE